MKAVMLEIVLELEDNTLLGDVAVDALDDGEITTFEVEDMAALVAEEVALFKTDEGSPLGIVEGTPIEELTIWLLVGEPASVVEVDGLLMEVEGLAVRLAVELFTVLKTDEVEGEAVGPLDSVLLVPPTEKIEVEAIVEFKAGLVVELNPSVTETEITVEFKDGVIVEVKPSVVGVEVKVKLEVETGLDEELRNGL